MYLVSFSVLRCCFFRIGEKIHYYDDLTAMFIVKLLLELLYTSHLPGHALYHISTGLIILKHTNFFSHHPSATATAQSCAFDLHMQAHSATVTVHLELISDVLPGNQSPHASGNRKTLHMVELLTVLVHVLKAED